MELKYKLLDHPFYQSWNTGAISHEQLSKYAAAYLDFIKQMPLWWSRINGEFGIDNKQSKDIIAEESSHIPLWQEWSSFLPAIESYPELTDSINEFNNMTASELLGAVHAFEIQQPEVAKLKKEVLIKYYGFNADTLSYFDEHMNEQEHIDFGKFISENHADHTEFKKGFEKGSEIIYHSLDKFIS